ncbi:hypothetical protein ADUPG1_013145 [Aduncisulcus paluster]|uniref:Uncharacterized protein n=1 Tax=Aduncisulcus paluster TaxID=2918883 RepID=A0ABQ5K634_9EUKA|nr:hypothetical protein ADUPG1_013145 [Aduncisulcus paluster]
MIDPEILERETRFELATSTLGRLHSTAELFPLKFNCKKEKGSTVLIDPEILERETRFELATPTLARLYSTTELFPLMEAASRFELENGGFADLCLTTWLCRLKHFGAGNEI